MSKTAILVALLAVTGCVDGDRVSMSRADHQAIVGWRDAVTEWAACMEGE